MRFKRSPVKRDFESSMATSKHLSAKGLLNIPRNPSVNDFSVVFGSGRYECTRFFAAFLSPRLCECEVGGLPQDEFIFETELTVDDFDNFISHCCSSFSGLREEERRLFISTARELGNSEIYSLVASNCEGISQSIVDHFSACAVGKAFESISGEEIAILANHFHELPDHLLKDCPIELLGALLSHGDLKIKDEDSLLTFLRSLWTVDPAYFVLSEFVRFEFVSAIQIEDFVESSCSFLGEFNSGIWRSLGRRLMLPVRLDGVRRRRLETVESVAIPFKSGAPLDGIVRYLSGKCRGNVHAKHIITITASSQNENFWVHHLADLDSDNFFNSENRRDQWFCYDFKDQRIVLTHYSVRTYQYAEYNPRSWVVESSADGENWTEIDRKVSGGDLYEVKAVRTFPIANPEECRMVRFRQIGPNHANNHYLCLLAFEVFGTLHGNAIH
jgi:hypothetical protein